MPMRRCYYHIVWATKGREPIITPNVEKTLFRAIELKAKEMDCSLLAINAVSDHIHIAVAIPPTLSVADWMKHVKGVSSREVNEGHSDARNRFRWQGSYSVLTVGERHLPLVVDYVNRQKEHHAAGNLYSALEYVGD